MIAAHEGGGQSGGGLGFQEYGGGKKLGHEHTWIVKRSRVSHCLSVCLTACLSVQHNPETRTGAETVCVITRVQGTLTCVIHGTENNFSVISEECSGNRARLVFVRLRAESLFTALHLCVPLTAVI